MRPQTVAPSRALKLTRRGSIQSLEKNSGIGEFVTGLREADALSSIGRFGSRYSSGGLLLYDRTSASIVSSGEISTWFCPGNPVICVRLPPSMGIEKRCLWKTLPSLEVK